MGKSFGIMDDGEKTRGARDGGEGHADRAQSDKGAGNVSDDGPDAINEPGPSVIIQNDEPGKANSGGDNANSDEFDPGDADDEEDNDENENEDKDDFKDKADENDRSDVYDEWDAHNDYDSEDEGIVVRGYKDKDYRGSTDGDSTTDSIDSDQLQHERPRVSPIHLSDQDEEFDHGLNDWDHDSLSEGDDSEGHEPEYQSEASVQSPSLDTEHHCKFVEYFKEHTKTIANELREALRRDGLRLFSDDQINEHLRATAETSDRSTDHQQDSAFGLQAILGIFGEKWGKSDFAFRRVPLSSLIEGTDRLLVRQKQVLV